MKFWLGAHMVSWLDGRAGPVMVSRNRLAARAVRAEIPWVLDSGGFTEITQFGYWRLSAPDYAILVRRYRDEIGMMEWAAPQDWMCEPFALARTRKSVAEHQRLTVENLVELRTIDAELRVIPVLQGWSRDDYLRCVDLYADAGVDLTAEPLVGLGSVCRRQATDEIGRIVSDLHSLGLALHGFGCKTEAIRNYGTWLASADSMAWSYGGRRVRPCPLRPVKNCANCLHYALDWLDGIKPGARPLQGDLWGDR